MPSSCETLGVEPGCTLTDRLERERDEAREDARAARRERDEAIRTREEQDTEAQHRATQYCREKREAERERDEALAKLDWLTMRGTDELPREDPSGNLIVAPTGDALVEYLRAQRRSERDRAEKAERERDEALAEVERLKGEVVEVRRDARERVILLVASMERMRREALPTWGSDDWSKEGV